MTGRRTEIIPSATPAQRPRKRKGANLPWREDGRRTAVIEFDLRPSNPSASLIALPRAASQWAVITDVTTQLSVAGDAEERFSLVYAPSFNDFTDGGPSGALDIGRVYTIGGYGMSGLAGIIGRVENMLRSHVVPPGEALALVRNMRVAQGKVFISVAIY